MTNPAQKVERPESLVSNTTYFDGARYLLEAFEGKEKQIADLKSKLEALEADKARLDWLDEVRPQLLPHKERHGEGGWTYWWSVVLRKRAMGHPLGYVRPAIDQARVELAKHKESQL